MVDERHNYDALREFGSFWHNAAQIQWFNTNAASFHATVAYGFRNQVQHIDTEVTYFPDSGKLWIRPDGWLTADDFYTESSVAYQEFDLTEAKALRISGSGPKLGRYWIEISPLKPFE